MQDIATSGLDSATPSKGKEESQHRADDSPSDAGGGSGPPPAPSNAMVKFDDLDYAIQDILLLRQELNNDGLLLTFLMTFRDVCEGKVSVWEYQKQMHKLMPMHLHPLFNKVIRDVILRVVNRMSVAGPGSVDASFASTSSVSSSLLSASSSSSNQADKGPARRDSVDIYAPSENPRRQLITKLCTDLSVRAKEEQPAHYIRPWFKSPTPGSPEDGDTKEASSGPKPAPAGWKRRSSFTQMDMIRSKRRSSMPEFGSGYKLTPFKALTAGLTPLSSAAAKSSAHAPSPSVPASSLMPPPAPPGSASSVLSSSGSFNQRNVPSSSSFNSGRSSPQSLVPASSSSSSSTASSSRSPFLMPHFPLSNGSAPASTADLTMALSQAQQQQQAHSQASSHPQSAADLLAQQRVPSRHSWGYDISGHRLPPQMPPLPQQPSDYAPQSNTSILPPMPVPSTLSEFLILSGREGAEQMSGQLPQHNSQQQTQHQPQQAQHQTQQPSQSLSNAYGNLPGISPDALMNAFSGLSPVDLAALQYLASISPSTGPYGTASITGDALSSLGNNPMHQSQMQQQANLFHALANQATNTGGMQAPQFRNTSASPFSSFPSSMLPAGVFPDQSSMMAYSQQLQQQQQSSSQQQQAQAQMTAALSSLPPEYLALLGMQQNAAGSQDPMMSLYKYHKQSNNQSQMPPHGNYRM